MKTKTCNKPYLPIGVFIALLFLLTSSMLLASTIHPTGEKKMKKSIRVLIVGGGSSHDFDRWYKEADVETLRKDGFATVTYIDDVSQILPNLPKIDVLYLSNNQPIEDSETRKAIFEFVNAGKGLVLCHAALWYNWADWPAYNRELVSGGTKNHDAYGPFEVTVLNTKHPVTKGVPAKFTLKDELYHYKVDSSAGGIQVLATAHKAGAATSFPSVFIVKHPKARIVGIALGHDAASHDFAPYQTLLKNAIKWVAHK